MLVGLSVKFNIPKSDSRSVSSLRCTFGYNWKDIPIYITEDGRNIYSIILKDGTSLIVISADVMNMYNNEMMEAALWHEVSHIANRDCLLAWDINYEYRADSLAALATSRECVIRSLEIARCTYTTQSPMAIIDKRIDMLKYNVVPLNMDMSTLLSLVKPASVRWHDT